MNQTSTILSCLDSLAIALTEHEHQWTAEQRKAYEESVAVLTTSDCMETDS